MAFPTVPTVAGNTLLSSTTSPASTTHTFPSLTTLAPAAGDLIIAICVQYEGDTTPQFSSWGASLTEILDDSITGTGNGGIGVAYKIASGSESGTFTVTSADSFKSVNFLMRIPAATWHGTTAPEVQAASRAAGAAADPGTFDPANWAAEDTLWISVAGQTETSTTGSPPTLTASPTNYSGNLIVARVADAVGDITAGVGFRQVNASSEDVGTWTGTNLNRGSGVATVIAVRPSDAVIETPTPGGGTAGGAAPVALTTSATGGAPAAGTTPSPITSVATGGAVGAGLGATASASAAAGGSVAGGQSPTALVALAPGGAVAGGVAPTEDIGGGGVTETPTPGGAVAGGTAPVVTTLLTASGAVAVGLSPSFLVLLASGGAVSGGTAPTEDFPGAVVYSRNFDMPSPAPTAFDPPVPIGQMD